MNWQEHSIKEIREYLKEIDVSEKTVSELAADSRSGVRKLAKKYRRINDKKKERREHWHRLNSRQNELKQKGYKLVAGIDEAGRGPLAGPVVAAAVILDPEIEIIGIDDSKKLNETEREELFDLIKKKAVAWGTGIVDNKKIDRVNILNATFLAMKKAVKDLEYIPDYILVDGNRKIPDINLEQETVIDGDSKVNSIAAASIAAKVTRDHIIENYHSDYPEYGFPSNKGYGTREHIEALKKYGPTPIHRFSFAIVNKYGYMKYKERLEQAETENELYLLGKEIERYSSFSGENLDSLRKLYREQYQSIVNK